MQTMLHISLIVQKKHLTTTPTMYIYIKIMNYLDDFMNNLELLV